MTRAAALALLVLACASSPRPQPETRESRALAIAGEVYRMPLVGARVSYVPVVCRAYGEWPGYLTNKGNCVRGAVAPWSPVVVVAGQPGMPLADSGFCDGAFELVEISQGRAPNQDSPGEAALVAACREALRRAGL